MSELNGHKRKPPLTKQERHARANQLGAYTRIGNQKLQFLAEHSSSFHYGETPKAHAAFLMYCSLGIGRSLPKVTDKLAHPRSYDRQLEQWSRKYNWQERVKIFDREQFEEEQRRNHEAIEQMNDRQVQLGLVHQRKAMESIDALIKKGKLGGMASVQLLKLAVDVERMGRGAETEHTQMDLAGKDGGPIRTNAQVQIGVILPKKDVPLALPPPGLGASVEEMPQENTEESAS